MFETERRAVFGLMPLSWPCSEMSERRDFFFFWFIWSSIIIIVTFSLQLTDLRVSLDLLWVGAECGQHDAVTSLAEPNAPAVDSRMMSRLSTRSTVQGLRVCTQTDPLYQHLWNRSFLSRLLSFPIFLFHTPMSSTFFGPITSARFVHRLA